MIQKLKSMKGNKKGFTLAELLIVVAIIAVLAAIAVPMFTVQLNNAKNAVIQSNMGSAMSMAKYDYMTEHGNTGTETYKYTVDAKTQEMTKSDSGEYSVTISNGTITAASHPKTTDGKTTIYGVGSEPTTPPT